MRGVPRPSVQPPGGGDLPRPGKALRAVLLLLLVVWVAFAVALQWGGADPSVFFALAGNTEALAGGQIWRLFTAPLLHAPQSPWHLVGSLIGLYFLTPALEARWSSRRLLGFLVAAGALAYAAQALAEAWLPAGVGQRLSSGTYFGAIPVVEAVAVAWALHFRDQTVRLFFVLPVGAKQLLAFIVGFSVLRVLAVEQAPEGLVSPFGGMVAGWLLGGGSPSPLRRAYLRLRYRALQRETERLSRPGAPRKPTGRKGGLRVIDGGRKDKNGSSLH